MGREPGAEDPMRERVLSRDHLTGISERWLEDADGGVRIALTQNAQPIVDANRAAYNDTDERAGFKGDLHLMARIPLSVLFMPENRGLLEQDQQTIKRFLNDPDNKHFRVRPGRV